MRVLLFDIDGVLNDHTFNDIAKSNTLLSRCVKQFNRIIHSTDCKLVISSAWRYQVLMNATTLLGFSYMLRTHGVTEKAEIIGMTASDEQITNRVDQIVHWVQNANGVDSWVAVDDLTLELSDDHFVRTNGKVGLTEADADEIIKKLTGMEAYGDKALCQDCCELVAVKSAEVHDVRCVCGGDLCNCPTCVLAWRDLQSGRVKRRKDYGKENVQSHTERSPKA